MRETGGKEETPKAFVCGAERPRKAEEELISYICSLDSALSTQLSSNSETAESSVLIENLFEEILQNEASLASSKKSSAVLENFLNNIQISSNRCGILKTFITNVADYFGWLSYNRFSSHVLETYFRACCTCINLDPQGSEELISTISLLTDQILEKEEWWNLIFHASGTHVLRGLLNLLSNDFPVKKAKTTSLIYQINKRRNLVEKKPKIKEFKVLLTKFLVAFSRIESKELQTVMFDINASPALQKIIEFGSDAKNAAGKNNSRTWNNLVFAIINSPEEDLNLEAFTSLSSHAIASHVMEVIVANSSEGFITNLIATISSEVIVQLAEDKFGNYVVQAIVSKAPKLDDLNILVSKLETSITERLVNRNYGVIWQVTEKTAELKNSETQSLVLNQIQKGVKSDNLTLGLLFLSSDEKEKVSVLGGLIVKNLIKFENRKVLSEVGNLEKDILKLLSCDSVGGKEVLEPLFVNDKNTEISFELKNARKNIMKKFIEDKILIDCSLNKFGWHLARKMFDCSSIVKKKQMLDCLKESKAKLVGNPSGLQIVKHVKLQLYSQNEKQWSQFFENQLVKETPMKPKQEMKRKRDHKNGKNKKPRK